MTEQHSSLYPDWHGPATKLPNWVQSYGLMKYRPLISRFYASAPKWQQAEQDGIPQVIPMIACYNLHPHQIREEIGGAHWKAIHHSSLKGNIDRLVLRWLAGWTIDEAMLFPVADKRLARSILETSKGCALLSCRLWKKNGDLSDNIILAGDVQRMGGTLDQTWTYNRLKREHDALAIKNIIGRSNPEPWAKPWFLDVGEYSFSLLKSETELRMEGAQQRHCAGSYAAACRTGNEFVLRIEGAERATCSWRKGVSHLQVKGFANSTVSLQCRRAAEVARDNYMQHLKELGKK